MHCGFPVISKYEGGRSPFRWVRGWLPDEGGALSPTLERGDQSEGYNKMIDIFTYNAGVTERYMETLVRHALYSMNAMFVLSTPLPMYRLPNTGVSGV